MQVGGVFRILRLMLVLLTCLLLASGAGGVDYKGVSPRNGRYCCSVRVPGKNYTLWVGTYETELEAARANDVAAHYVGTEFNFHDYHPSLESVLAPFPSHLSLNKANRLKVKEFVKSQVDGLLQDRRRRLPRKRRRSVREGDDVHVDEQHLQGIQMDQAPAHDEPSVLFPALDWTDVPVPEQDYYPCTTGLDWDVDDLTFLEESILSDVANPSFTSTVQQFCQGDTIVTENERGLGGQLEQLGLQAAIDHSLSQLPDTQIEPPVDVFGGLDQLLLSEREGIMDVPNQNLVGQDLMMLVPFESGGAMATDTSCLLCASKKIASHLLSYNIRDPIGVLKSIVSLFQDLKETHMLDSTFDEGCEFPLCTTHQEENHGEGDEFVREQANPTRGIALPSSNDNPLSGLTQNIFMYVSSTRIHPILFFKFILPVVMMFVGLSVRPNHKKEFESCNDMVVVPPLGTQIGCGSYHPRQYLPRQASSSTTPDMHPRDRWRYVIDRSSDARGEIRRNVETWEISKLVEVLNIGPSVEQEAQHREAAIKALINLSEVKELMGRFEEAKVIPSLLAILRDDNENCVIRDGSISILYELCEKTSMEKAILDSDGVPSLIHLFQNEIINLSWETEEKAFFILAFLIKETFATIKKSSAMLDIAIPLLIDKLLLQCVSVVQRGVTYCIGLLAKVPEYSCIFGSRGVIPILFESLKDKRELIKKTDLYALQKLFDANKNEFNPCIAIPILVDGLREFEDETDRTIAAKLLQKLLIEIEENFVTIDESGAIPALLNLLYEGPPLYKLFAARKLIDICTKHEQTKNILSSGVLIPPLITILEEGDKKEKEGVVLCLLKLSMHAEYDQMICAIQPLQDIVRKDVAAFVTAIAASILKLILPSGFIKDNPDLSSIILNSVLQAMKDANMVEKEQVVTQFLFALIQLELNDSKAVIEEWTPIIALLVDMLSHEITPVGKEAALLIFIALGEQDRYRTSVLKCGAIRALKCLLQTDNSREKKVAVMGLMFLFERGDGMDEFVGLDGMTSMIEIIRKEDPSVKIYALQAICHLSKVITYKVVIRQWSSFFLSLFDTLIKDRAGDLIVLVSRIVVNILEGEKGKEDFEHSNAFPVLLHELQYGTPNMREIAATCLLTFSFVYELTACFGRSDVIPTLINILRTGSLKEKVNSGKILTILFLQDVKFQISIVTSGALLLFVDLLKTAGIPYDKMIASIFLYKFFQLGNGQNVIEELESNIAFQIEDLRRHTPPFLENLIRHEINDIINNHGVIFALVNILGDEDCELQKLGALCLCQLAHIDKYKLVIGDNYAIPPLIDILRNGSDSETKIIVVKVLFRLSDLRVNRDRLNKCGTIPALVNLMVTGNALEKQLVVYILVYFFTCTGTYWNEIIKVTLKNSIDAKNVLFDITKNEEQEEYKESAETLFNRIYIVGENNAPTPMTLPIVEGFQPRRDIIELRLY